MISLKNLCFNLIVQEFERFHSAFSDSKNEILKRNFEFLQKKYSSKLGSELYKRGELVEEYLEFLLNKHLKFLDVKWLKCSRYQKCMKAIFRRLPNLKEISGNEANILMNDEILENISKFCPKIVEIKASFSFVTDAGIAYLLKNENDEVPCPNLKKLSIDCSRVTDEGLMHLIRNLPSLEKIEHKNIAQILYSFHKEDLLNLKKLPSYNLIDLDLFEDYNVPYYTDLLQVCLTVCPKLKSLKCIISKEEQLHLFTNTTLAELTLHGLDTNPRININNFLKISGCELVVLNIFHCLMSMNVLAASCPKLKYLDIDDTDYLNDHVDSQSIFHCLTECVFQYADSDSITNTAMSFLLSSSPNLVCLKFEFCDLSAETKMQILKCCENNNLLENICFSYMKVEVKFIKDILLCCSSLKTLSLKDYTDFDHNVKMEIIDIAKTLPNNPVINFFKK